MEGAETVMHADFIDDAVRTLRAAAPGDLARVAEAAAVVAHGDHLLVQVVREARRAGRSWSQIAAQLQVSTAQARQRWGPPRSGAGHVDLQWSPPPAPHEKDQGTGRLVGAAAPGPGLRPDERVAPAPSA